MGLQNGWKRKEAWWSVEAESAEKSVTLLILLFSHAGDIENFRLGFSYDIAEKKCSNQYDILIVG